MLSIYIFFLFDEAAQTEDMMNDSRFEQHWFEIKHLIAERWKRLSASDVDSLKGNLEDLVARIQAAYGCARARAEMEYHEFRTSLRPLLQPPAVAPIPVERTRQRFPR